MSVALTMRLPANGFFGSRRSARSPWRARAGLFLVLGALLLVNAAVLVTYRIFYDVRFHALSQTRDELTRRRDEAKAAAQKALETEKRLVALQRDLDVFHREVLGDRKEKLAQVIEGIYAITGKAGFSPATIAYAEDAVPGAQRLALTFGIQGRYKDVKKLLHAFEADPGFLVLEQVGVGTEEADPDMLKINLTVAHYFRSDAPSAPRRPVREPEQAGRPAPPPATEREPQGVPE